MTHAGKRADTVAEQREEIISIGNLSIVKTGKSGMNYWKSMQEAKREGKREVLKEDIAKLNPAEKRALARFLSDNKTFIWLGDTDSMARPLFTCVDYTEDGRRITVVRGRGPAWPEITNKFVAFIETSNVNLLRHSQPFL